MTFEYLRQTLFFFRSHFSVIARIQLPFLIILSIVGVFAMGSLEDNSPQQRQLLAGLAFANFTLIPIYWGATIAYFGSVVDGRPYTVGQSISQALSRWRQLLIVYVLTGLAAGTGFMLLIIPGIYLLIRFAFADYFCVNEGMKAVASLKASWQTTNDYFWHLLPGLAILFTTLSGAEILLDQLLLTEDSSPIMALPIDLFFGLLHSLLTIYGFRIYCVMKEENPNIMQQLQQD